MLLACIPHAIVFPPLLRHLSGRRERAGPGNNRADLAGREASYRVGILTMLTDPDDDAAFVHALVEAATDGPGFLRVVAGILTSAAARLGSTDALTASRPGAATAGGVGLPAHTRAGRVRGAATTRPGHPDALQHRPEPRRITALPDGDSGFRPCPAARCSLVANPPCDRRMA